MTHYMLLFSLGPVQPFIAQARKTRDLWLGSFLLSALMQASMKGIEQEKLVFPNNPSIAGNIPDLPNKYIAIFDEPEQAVETANKSESQIKEFWQNLCNDVWNIVFKNTTHTTNTTRKLWDNQINATRLFEIFWVVVAGNPEQYPAWLNETQQELDRRKRLRNFEQQTDTGEKSTISGQRSALRGEGEWRSDVQTFWRGIAQRQSPRDISADGTERLDAIDTVKRFAFTSKTLRDSLKDKLDAGFPSTSSIAAAPYMERLITTSEHPLVSLPLTSWLKEVKKLGETMPSAIPLLDTLSRQNRSSEAIVQHDGECFFLETFSEKRLEDKFRLGQNQIATRKAFLKSGPKALSTLLEATSAFTPPIPGPTPYYAMIEMDGDKMGELMKKVQGKEEHKNISQALSIFSRAHAPALVEEHYPGRLIYAGGDDVCALAPLTRSSVMIQPEEIQNNNASITTVLDLVYHLQKQYREVVQPRVIDSIQPANGETKPSRKALVTASTGIAIAHHYAPLSYVRRLSKEAEQLAKKHYGRNALVVTVLRRSGEQTRVGCHWQYSSSIEDKQQQPIQPILLFLSFYKLFIEDTLSPKCVFTLLEEAPTLVKLEEAAQISEIKRVLRRQRNPASAEAFSDEAIIQKATEIVALAKAMDNDPHPQIPQGHDLSVELHSSGRRYGLVEVLGWLLVMLFLARKEQV